MQLALSLTITSPLTALPLSSRSQTLSSDAQLPTSFHSTSNWHAHHVVGALDNAVVYGHGFNPLIRVD